MHNSCSCTSQPSASSTEVDIVFSIICVSSAPDHSAAEETVLNHSLHNRMTLYVVPSSCKQAFLTCRWTAKKRQCTHHRMLQKSQQLRLQSLRARQSLRSLKHSQNSQSMRGPSTAMAAPQQSRRQSLLYLHLRLIWVTQSFSAGKQLCCSGCGSCTRANMLAQAHATPQWLTMLASASQC